MERNQEELQEELTKKIDGPFRGILPERHSEDDKTKAVEFFMTQGQQSTRIVILRLIKRWPSGAKQ